MAQHQEKQLFAMLSKKQSVMKNNAPLSVWIHFIKSLIDLLFIKFSLTPD